MKKILLSFVIMTVMAAIMAHSFPWFDQPGMATQVVLPMPVKDLLANGSLERIEYR
jgi:hypothetical protein